MKGSNQKRPNQTDEKNAGSQPKTQPERGDK